MILDGAKPSLCCALLWSLGLPALHAAETAAPAPSATNAPAAHLRLFTDKTPTGKLERGVLQVGNQQFSFVTPDGFRSAFDSGTGKTQLVSTDPPAVISIEVLPSTGPTAPAIDAGLLRKIALSQYEGAQVIDEFEVSVENWRGSAIEIEWAIGRAKKNSLRLAHIPLPGGTLVFTVRAAPDRIRACDHPFNHLLLSMRAGLNGVSPGFQQRLADQ